MINDGGMAVSTAERPDTAALNPVHEHHVAGAQLGMLLAAVITLSDTRTEADDHSGRAIRELLAEGGHQVIHYAVMKDDPRPLRSAVRELLDGGNVDFIITNGGTGISPRDQTIEAIRPLLQKELEGFGDLFRFLSYQDVGSAALLSRATAGVAGRNLIFCLPGSRGAVRLAMEKLILPELRHLLSQLRKD